MVRTLTVVLLLGACAPSTRSNEVTTHPAAPPIPPFVTCDVYTADDGAYGAAHVPPCTAITPESFPPTSGTHFSAWADFGRYDAPVPWGYLVHSMEHGAVVIAYRCPAGCPELRASLEELMDAQPVDPLCRGEDPNRLILAPAPDLVQPIAVLAWERIYLATCFDRPSIEAFIADAYARAPENFCTPGVGPGAAGWCPAP